MTVICEGIALSSLPQRRGFVVHVESAACTSRWRDFTEDNSAGDSICWQQVTMMIYLFVFDGQHMSTVVWW